MPKSQLAGGSAAEIAAEGPADLGDDPSQDLDGTPDEPATDPAPPSPDPASAPADVTEDELEDELDEDLDDAPSDDQPPESPADASGESAAESAGEPFTFRADGKEFAIPGAMRYDDGVYIPADAVGKLQEHLADRRGLNDRIRQLEHLAEERNPERHPEVLKARALTQQIQKLMAQGPEAMAEWLDDLERNRPILEARAEAAALKQQLEGYTTRESTAATEQQATQLADEMDRTLGTHLDEILKDPAIASLGLDRNRLQVRLYRMAEQLFGEADRDYREWGIRKGDLTINLELLRAEVNDAAALARQYGGQAAQRQKAKAVNAGAVNAAAPPPVVNGSKTATTRDTGRKAPKNREEWEERMRAPIGLEP